MRAHEFLIENKNTRKMWHVSPSRNRASILSYGLKPQAVSDRKRKPGIYMFADKFQAREWAWVEAEGYAQAEDIWEIVLPTSYILDTDTHPDLVNYNAYIGYEPIPVAQLQLIETQDVPKEGEEPPYFEKISDAEHINSNLVYQGNCTEDKIIEYIFGDVNNFTNMIEKHGNNFTIGDLVVKYNPKTDIHSFYYKKQSVSEGGGYIPKNKKEAKDPRWCMAITGDIKPGEPQRQANKLGFKTDKTGRPLVMRPDGRIKN